MPDRDFTSADYLLRWPGDILARELTAVRGLSGDVGDRIEFLLDEAFVGDVPAQRYRAVRPSRTGDPWSENPDPWADGDLERDFLDGLAAALPQLRTQVEARPYWPDRKGRDGDILRKPALHRRFVQLIGQLRRIGHFGSEIPEECVDDQDPPDPEVLLAERLGVAGLWPLQPATWDEDTFYGLIEVFHDLAVRPRERYYHQFDGCGWHYQSFSLSTGQALYRWRVNRLLDAAANGLRLAATGEDTGRLVQVTDAGRADLLVRVQATPDVGVAGRIDHAIALFRGRSATEHDKRSAIITLAGVLEERRQLIRSEVGRKDEGALFLIANEFAVRHQNRSQQSDYDLAFLDWIYWWYLATVELTQRIGARDQAAHRDDPNGERASAREQDF